MQRRRGNVCVRTRLYYDRSYRCARMPGGYICGYLDVASMLLCGQLRRSVTEKFAEIVKAEVRRIDLPKS
jgi:hypothetical protein